MVDRTFFIESYGSKINYLNFTLFNWHKEITVYYHPYIDTFLKHDNSICITSLTSSFNSLFEELSKHVDRYIWLKIDIRTLPLNISFLNLILPKIMLCKINSISISWENLESFNFNEKIIGLKILNLYLHNPTKNKLFNLISSLTPKTFVDIKCYENGPLNVYGCFTSSKFLNSLQNKMVLELQKNHIPYKSYL